MGTSKVIADSAWSHYKPWQWLHGGQRLELGSSVVCLHDDITRHKQWDVSGVADLKAWPSGGVASLVGDEHWCGPPCRGEEGRGKIGGGGCWNCGNEKL